jgi:hypothetical protein
MRPIHPPTAFAFLSISSVLLAANAEAAGPRRCEISPSGRVICSSPPAVDRSTSYSPDQRFWQFVKSDGSCAIYRHRDKGQTRTFCDE